MHLWYLSPISPWDQGGKRPRAALAIVTLFYYFLRVHIFPVWCELYGQLEPFTRGSVKSAGRFRMIRVWNVWTLFFTNLSKLMSYCLQIRMIQGFTLWIWNSHGKMRELLVKELTVQDINKQRNIFFPFSTSSHCMKLWFISSESLFVGFLQFPWRILPSIYRK